MSMIKDIKQSVSSNSEAVINILNEPGIIEYVDLRATYTDGTPAPVQVSLIIDNIETDITSYALSQYKPDIEFKANMNAQLKIVNPNANDIIVRGIVKYRIIHERPQLYLVYGNITNFGNYMGLYYDTTPPSGTFTILEKVADFREKIYTYSIKPKGVLEVIIPVLSKWVKINHTTSISNLRRLIYPINKETSWNGPGGRDIYDHIPQIHYYKFTNTTTATINTTISINYDPSVEKYYEVSEQNVNVSPNHLILIPKLNKVIVARDITQFLLGEVEV